MARMREADRPPEVRVSVLDCEPTAADRAAAASTPLLSGLRIVESRVALRAIDNVMLVGRDADEGLYFTIQQESGGGATGGGTRGELRKRGALTMVCGTESRLFVGGIVCDEVTAVRVGGVSAHLERNAFLAQIGHGYSRVPASLVTARYEIIITTPVGDREVGPRTA
jgi:hypothetical protein